MESKSFSPTVFVVDDDSDVRRTVSLLMRSVDLNVETFPTARDFLEIYEPHRPGCLVLDMRMPGMTGSQLQQELSQQGVTIPIVFVTAHGEIAAATAALRAGAVDFIPKPFSPQVLLERIHEALSIDAKQRRSLAMREEVESRIGLLTDREREVMELLAQGFSTKAIASRLRISTKTVDNHRARVLEKMEVDNAAQLAVVVGQLGKDPVQGRASARAAERAVS